MLPVMNHWRVRILGVVVAVIICAWFAIGIRQSHDTDRASDIITGSSPLAPGQAHRAATLLDGAKQLNPDATIDLLRAQLAAKQGDGARARAIALSVTRREPENIQAWLAYGSASTNDRHAFLQALRHLRALAPPVPASG